MTKEQFILAFTGQFCAAWAANNYNDFCARGIQESLTTSMPVEDGAYLAKRAWERMEDLTPEIIRAVNTNPTEAAQPHYIDPGVALDGNERLK